ncbi:MAG: thioredoxin domain-containing protein, partial [Chloroflexi bacterium]|nr:thioredoxin domain-containing protein [Chloroflexota bacterium]
MTNHLAGETSPYLLQHADNPVDWYPWGDEALSRARAEDKPILLSIGYSACHWCHVMAHESFENQETASLMNEHFINIKVDREERPDLDTIYMQAVQAITGRGGWPLTVFLTPEAKPFFGGTYFPPEDRFGMAGFPRVIQAVADTYHNRRPEIDKTTEELFAALSSEKAAPLADEPLTADILQEAYLALQQSFDARNGGFDGAPKFPQPMALEFLLRYFHRTRDTAAMDMIDSTLEKMAKGGIYDQIGGGFHRYSTDDYWLVPHFEKMLYDNALLSQVYLHAYLASGKPLFRSIAEETLDYVLREMTDASGGFYSTQDADSEGIEGKYFVWTPQEIAEVLGDEAGQAVCRRFGVTAKGNFDHGNILYVADDQADASITKEAKSSLLKKREQRIKPGRDEKILASWNGLMLTSMAEAACVLDRQDYLAAATANGRFLLDSMMADDRLKHTCKDGQTKIDGYLDDYAM